LVQTDMLFWLLAKLLCRLQSRTEIEPASTDWK
jgi:hypothetical protein